MNWAEAVEFMQKDPANRGTRKHWLRADYLYMKNGVLYCDADYEYLHLLRNTNGQWFVWEDYD